MFWKTKNTSAVGSARQRTMPLTSSLGACFVMPPRCNKVALQIVAPRDDVFESDYVTGLFTNLPEKRWIRAFKMNGVFLHNWNLFIVIWLHFPILWKHFKWILARKRWEPSKAQIWPLNMSGSTAERKVTNFGQFQPFNSLKKVFNGNNSVHTRSSLRGKDLGWWLVLLTDH